MLSFVVMKPRLEAIESMRRSTETSVGTGSMKKEAARDITRSWRRVAIPHRRARVAGDKDLAGLPIKVTRVPKEP